MIEHGHHKQRIEHAEICKTITKKAREDKRKYNQEIIRETIMASNRLRKVRRTQTHQEKIIERIEEFYTKLYDSEQSTVIHTDPEEVPEITSWEVEAPLRDLGMAQ